VTLQYQAGPLSGICRGFVAGLFLVGIVGCQPVMSLSSFVPSQGDKTATDESPAAAVASGDTAITALENSTAAPENATTGVTPETRTSGMESSSMAAPTEQAGPTADTSLGPAIRAQAGRPIGQQLLERGIKTMRPPSVQQP